MLESQLIDAIALEAQVSRALAREMLRALKAIVEREVAAGGDVVLCGLCRFRAKHFAERTLRQPVTGEPILVPPMDLPMCEISEVWRDAAKRRARGEAADADGRSAGVDGPRVPDGAARVPGAADAADAAVPEDGP